MDLLNNQEYIDKLGLACPNCQSTEGINTWGRLEMDGGVAWQEIACSLCKAEWTDNYNLVGYSDLDIGGDDE